jgi:hypothetical protein
MNKDTVKAFIGKFRVASGLQQLSDKLLEKVDNETITSDEIEQISRYVGLTKTTTAKYGKHTSNAGTGYEEDKVTIKSDIDAPPPVITYNSVTYELNEAGTEYSITGVTDKTLTTYELKDYIKSVPVTSIGNSTFNSCSSLSSITIPASVTSIGDFAFSDCRSLSSINIPTSLTSIGDSAFYGCTSLSSVKVSWTTAETIPSITGKLVFNNTLLAKVLHVPAGTSALYATWKTDGGFASIVEDAV